MKSISSDYITQIKELGREYDAFITYTINNTTTTLTSADLNKVNPHYEGGILKSVMKQLDLDSNVDIPLETEINCQFGIKVNGSYEYVDFGNYIVYSSEKQKDLNSYRIVCYDKMLYAMKDYEDLEITYPISVKNYLTAICTKIGLTLATSEFVNDDTLIASERYLDSDGNSLEYTFRDVLDEIAQVTASTICINDNDEVEVRYITDAQAPSIQSQTRNIRSLRSDIEESLVPEGYTQVEYIKTPSNSFGPYIKITPSIGTKATLEFDFKVGTNGAGYLYGFNSSNNYDYKHTYSYIYNDLYVISVNRYENDSWTIEKNKKYKMKITRTGNTSTTYEMTDEDSTTIHSGSASQGYSIRENPFPIFATEYYVNNVLDNTEYSKDIYLYRFKVYSGWGGTTLDNDLVPCTRDSDNKPGLYDIVNNVFYVNVGTGEFEIPSPGPTPVGTITIDEEYLKDTNINFKEKYGPVNTLVLGRSLELDSIYRQDSESVEQNGVTEIKISDNQILNTDDREDFIDEMFTQLDGLEYYVNDYNSTGITFLDLCDRYNVQIGEETYDCVMFNDDIDITQGFNEKVYTDMPDENISDYNTMTKSDKNKNRVEFIIDKQNGRIESLAEKIIDISIDGATTTNNLTLEGIAESEPFYINVKPIENSITSMVPSSSLFPSSDTYPTPRILRFHNNTTNEDIDYTLPDDLLYYDENIYDEFVLDYENQICKVIKRCTYDNNGNVIPAIAHDDLYSYPTLKLTKGDYTISVFNQNKAYIYAKLMIYNDYTSQMATDVVLQSTITQTANQIMAQVNQKVAEDDIIASLNLAVENGQGIVELKGNVVTIDSDKFKLDEEGNVIATDLEIRGGSIKLPETGGAIEVYGVSPTFNNRRYIARQRAAAFSLLTNDVLMAQLHDGNESSGGVLLLNNANGDTKVTLQANASNCGRLSLKDDVNVRRIYLNGYNGEITCVYLTQTSLASEKKNYEKLSNALKIIKDTDIYKYHFKNEDDKNKKHIGLLIGDDFNYSKEITSNENDGVDIYSMLSVLWQAVKEQQDEIEKLKKQIKEMK